MASCFCPRDLFRLLAAEAATPVMQNRSMREGDIESIAEIVTSHHFLPVSQARVVSRPAFCILPLIPAPRSNPNTVSKKSVTTSWSRGESRSAEGKQRSSRRKDSRRTETAGFYITLLPRSSVRVSISKRSPLAYW